MIKKILAPIIFAVLAAAMIFLYIYAVINAIQSRLAAVLLGCALIAILTALFYVLIQRIKEIKEEKDDDLSQY